MKNEDVESPEILPLGATAAPDDHRMMSGAATYGADKLATRHITSGNLTRSTPGLFGIKGVPLLDRIRRKSYSAILSAENNLGEHVCARTRASTVRESLRTRWRRCACKPFQR
jgi:hypothetical protein